MGLRHARAAGNVLTPGQEGLGFRQTILQSVGFNRSQPHTCLDWCAWQAQLQVGVMGQSMIPLLRTTQPLESPDAHRPAPSTRVPMPYICAGLPSHQYYCTPSLTGAERPPLVGSSYSRHSVPLQHMLQSARAPAHKPARRTRVQTPRTSVACTDPKTGTCKPHSTPDSRTKCSRNMLKMLPSRQVDDFAKTLILPG